MSNGMSQRVAPRLDQKGLGGPIKAGEKIAEAEPEASERQRISAVSPRSRMVRVAPVKQPNEQAKAHEQHRPAMNWRESQHRNGPGEDREQGALCAVRPRNPIGCRLHGIYEHSAALGGWCFFALLLRVYAQFLDAPGICVQHLELDAARVAHQLAPRRDAAGEREHETPDRVDVLLLLGRDELKVEMPLERLDGHARIGDEAKTRVLADQRLVGDVMLVVDLADHLLDQILDGDEAVRAAIFVDHEGEMPPRQIACGAGDRAPAWSGGT